MDVQEARRISGEDGLLAKGLAERKAHALAEYGQVSKDMAFDVLGANGFRFLEYREEFEAAIVAADVTLDEEPTLENMQRVWAIYKTLPDMLQHTIRFYIGDFYTGGETPVSGLLGAFERLAEKGMWGDPNKTVAFILMCNAAYSEDAAMELFGEEGSYPGEIEEPGEKEES